MIKKVIGFILFISFPLLAQDANINHNLHVNLIPNKSQIEVIDSLTVKSKILNDKFCFTLNDQLNVQKPEGKYDIQLIEQSISANDVGMDNDSITSLKLNKYCVSGYDKSKDLHITIKYFGNIDSPIEQSQENYQRGFSESPGIISNLGVYLGGSTYWVPTVEDVLVTFSLTTELPSVWRTVSQGKRTKDQIEDTKHVDTWVSSDPQEEVFLIAAKFNEYKFSAGSVDAFAFLRTPDETLANKYLETTAQYLEMYRQLIGPYPYSKFALVENFWETGYGMPSFTLLGEKIIRFPFILHSSYPHELLHNWWGNSVYVDFDKGNWCEGLTAYMADHLIKEQRDQGEDYRRSTLQKYTDLVNKENDFPLSKFISRHDGPSEAIGYGKALMMFHMLREKFGDTAYIKAFQTFNRTNKFKKASFEDIEKAFESVTGENLKWFFDQWVNRKGAPKLKIGNIEINKKNKKYDIQFTLEQIQKGKPFKIDIPVYIVDKKGTQKQTVFIKDKVANISIKVDNEPIKILVDPRFDVFRRLDTKEIPPAFTKAYGARKTLMILPKKNDEKYSLYKNFAEGWIKGKEDQFEIKTVSEIFEVPKDKTVWFLGYNKYVDSVSETLENYHSSIATDSIKLNRKSFEAKNNSFFVTVNNPKNIEETILFLSIGNDKAVPGLLRKLPHYGKYSYLAFEGDEPTNIEKGQWPVLGSPLVKSITQSAEAIEPVFKKREALAKLAPVFSSKRMLENISYLASDEMRGRELGSEELDLAAEYISKKFKAYGLLPGSDDGTYYQTFSHSFKTKGNLVVKNIIGILPGTNTKFEKAVVISAHYDHLGTGWPDVREGNEGKIHNGADDNASGVSVLLEIAKSLGKSFKPNRTIVFVAFSGEEEGLIGSKYFVDNYKKFPSNKIFANLNFDTVGRLFENKIMILNGNTAKEWKFIFMGTEYTTGIPAELITQELDASDQVSFIHKQIPAIQIFSGPNTDYHKPSDTFDKIDPDGLVKVATIGKEVIQYLADREEPMMFTGKIKRNNDANPQTKKGGRRVSTGTMPDFAYSGEGVKVGAVAEGSPGDKAGLQKGDIIKKLDGKAVKSLKEYSDLLKEHSPGDQINLEISRNGILKTLKLNLVAR